MKSLGPLGVSPASGYGHVVGTASRFFGEGTLNPRFYAWNSFFQIRPIAKNKKIQSIIVGPKDSFIYGCDIDIDKIEEKIDLNSDVNYVFIECKIDESAKIEKAEIITYAERKPLFEPEDDLERQTIARHFLGVVKKTKPFYKFSRNLSYPVIQSSYSVPIAIPACINGFRGILITTA
jgi:hypothetical protein